jgi:two-component system cell cycle response regulator
LKHDFPILVVEDNPVSRKLLEKTLTKAGYETVSLENGRKALEVFKERFFPIVLTDWMMPEMDGLELCRSIRQNDSASSGYVFIILLTAKDNKDDIVEGLESGADDYLTKPFNPSELIARLNTARRILELERSLREANEEIRILSITDTLTKTYNRAYLNDRFPNEIKKARRYRRPLSLVLCDIDHFKNVNDTYGHQIGDEVLKEFASSLMKSIRSDVDWVARYGGEEFLIILPETDFDGASRLAERLRTDLVQRVIKTQGNNIQITASFGVSGFNRTTPDERISPDLLIAKADAFLYQAKEEGRNRVRGNPL